MTKNPQEPTPEAIVFKPIILEPEYVGLDGKKRKGTHLEDAVQKLFEKHIDSVRRHIDRETMLDVEFMDSFTPDLLFHVPVTRYTYPDGVLSHIVLSGAAVMGEVTNDYLRSGADGVIQRVGPELNQYGILDKEDTADITDKSRRKVGATVATLVDRFHETNK